MCWLVTNGSHASYACVCAILWWYDDVVKSWSDGYKRFAYVVCVCVYVCVCLILNLMRLCYQILEWWLQTDRIRRMRVCVCVCAFGWWFDDVVKSWSDSYKRIAYVVCVCVRDLVMMRLCCKILEWWLQTDRIRRVCVCAIMIHVGNNICEK